MTALVVEPNSEDWLRERKEAYWGFGGSCDTWAYSELVDW